MSLCPRRGLVPLFIVLWLGLSAPAHAGGGIKDGAGLFKRETRDQADDAIEDIRRRTHKDLLIETVKKLSAEQLKDYRALKTEPERAEFFRALAEERAKRAGVDGVYVLLCRVPAVEEPQRGFFKFVPRTFTELLPPQVVGHAVVVTPPAADPYFPKEDRAALDAMLGGIRVKDRNQDQVLLDGVAFAGTKFENNARTLGAPPADTFRWTAVAWAAAALVGTWVAVGAVRGRVAARQGTPAPPAGVNEGLGALLGIAGGLWLCEAYQARGRSAAPPTPAAVPAAPPAVDEIPAEVPMHPDDLAAISRATEPWPPEDTEAANG
jgi:hypothetical protein